MEAGVTVVTGHNTQTGVTVVTANISISVLLAEEDTPAAVRVS